MPRIYDTNSFCRYCQENRPKECVTCPDCGKKVRHSSRNGKYKGELKRI